ncbi:MAG: glycerol-3-phosphate dehydrogenase/oxidase [Aquiluna sp.]
MNRQNQTETNKFEQFDVAIVGAGINGAVAAAALSAAGLKVLLVDKGDFAGFTSQESSNLVWGGIKYLQSYEFWLVFKLCLARNRLMRAYPNRIRQIGFLASLGPTAPFGRLLGTFGTLFYWGIGLFGTKPPASYSAQRAKKLEPNLITGRKAVKYFDAELPDNDSRFVFDFVKQATAKGAVAKNYTELVSANFDGVWKLGIRDANGVEQIEAKTVINAAGPFASKVSELLQTSTKASLVFSKGVHFVLNRKLTQKYQVLAFWDEQGRLFYVLPMGDRSMVGTTDTRVDDPVTEVTDEDIDFVLRQINAQMELTEPITKDQIVSARCGVRPLVVESAGEGNVADWHQLSRKHVVEGNKDRKVVTILGGKLTDCLNVGEELVGELNRFGLKVKVPGRWFGEGNQTRKEEFFDLIRTKATETPNLLADGLWRRHGEKAFEIVGDAELSDLVPGLGITEQEIRHIVQTEQVVVREDLLRRRLPISMARSEQEIAQNQKLQKLLVELGL